MSTGFINRAVAYLKDNIDHQQKNLLVLPSRRAMVFLQESMNEQFPAGWLPKMLVIDEFIQNFSKLEQADNISLLFILFEAYQEVNEEAQDFNDFLRWGPQLLVEFNDIDRYLVEADQLFQHVHEAKLIEQWSPDQEPSQMIIDYASFYAKQAELYQLFTKKLRAKGIGHQGLLLRDLIGNLEQAFRNFHKDFHSLFFLGFNAINPAEKQLIDFLKGKLRVELLWDADEYYMDERQEAGTFLRKHIPWAGNPLALNNDFKEAKELIELPCPNVYTQAKAAGAVVEKLLEKGVDQKGVALVLADEALLEPILRALPASVEKINITMGYPVKQSLLYRLLLACLQNYLAAIQRSKSEKLSLYYKNVLKIIENPLVSVFFESKGGSLDRFISNIKKLPSPYQNLQGILNCFEGPDEALPLIQALIPGKRLDLGAFLASLQDGLQIWVNKQYSLEQPDDFALESAAQVQQMLNRLEDLNQEHAGLLNEDGMIFLWQQLASMHQISFVGEPLEGLQVMGMLETRLLNFDHVILVGANEGSLPAKRRESAFIPYDIKKAYDLPGFEVKEAVFAYHVYRLVQHAKTTHFIYSTNTSGNSGEASRYVRQLGLELPRYNTLASRKQLKYPLEPIKQSVDPIEIPVEGEVKERFYNKLLKSEKGLSPSAMNKFRRCSLQYFWSYVMGVWQENEIAEELSADKFGTLVHKVLELIYQDLPNPIQAPELKARLDRLDHYVDLAKKDNDVAEELLEQGENEILMQLARLQLRDFLKGEVEYCENHEVEVLHHEIKLYGSIPSPQGDVPINGTIDRIDRVDGVLRVIDYKTGSVKDNDLELKAPGSKSSTEKFASINDKALQLMFYLRLLEQNQVSLKLDISAGVKAGIGLLKAAGKQYSYFSCFGAERIKKEQFETVNEALRKEMESMLSVENIVQTSDKTYCKFCDFKLACKKQHLEKLPY